MSSEATVDILLATYNGAQFLAAQIESLLSQTYGNWRLIARDDGSTDGSLGILKDYAGRHPGRIELLEDAEPGLGPCGNFGRLLAHASADYAMFCDQDDVWLPEKTERMIAAIQELEAECGGDTPLLVHCDLRVVDSALEMLAPSFWRYQRLNPVKGQFLNRLLIQNVVTGCASIANRAAVQLALPIPQDARMHDWWLALVAAAFGRVGYLPEALVLYRQHGTNTLGARRRGLWPIGRKVLTGEIGATARRVRSVLQASQQQAALFGEVYGARLPADKRDLIRTYAEISSLGPLARRRALLKHGFLLDGTMNAGLLALI